MNGRWCCSNLRSSGCLCAVSIPWRIVAILLWKGGGGDIWILQAHIPPVSWIESQTSYVELHVTTVQEVVKELEPDLQLVNIPLHLVLGLHHRLFCLFESSCLVDKLLKQAG